jgi:hypothetical protein
VVNGWIGELFAPANLDDTVRALVGAQDLPEEAGNAVAARERLATAQAQLSRLQAAITAGANPAGLVEAINQAQADRAAVQADLATPTKDALSMGDVRAMIESLGDVCELITDGSPADQAKLYRELRLDVLYEHQEAAVTITAAPRVVNARVRGGT